MGALVSLFTCKEVGAVTQYQVTLVQGGCGSGTGVALTLSLVLLAPVQKEPSRSCRG